MELIKAVHENDIRMVKELLESGTDPNEKGYEGVTPLVVASVHGNLEIALALLESGADTEWEPEGAQSALVSALVYGHDEIANLLLERGADPRAQDWLAFYYACEYGRIPFIHRFLNLGAPPDLQIDDEPTPLMEAAGRGNLDVVKILIDAGADPNRKNREGMTAYDIAVSNSGFLENTQPVIDFLDKTTRKSTQSLMAAVQAGNAELTEQLIAQGAQVNTSDREFQYSPLSWAAERGSKKIAQLLIDAGANIEVRDWMSQTPLWSAVSGNHTSVARLLIKAGADVNVVDDSGDTLLQHAVWCESTRSIRLLLEAGADVNAVRAGHPAALHWAVAKEENAIVDLLLSHGAEPNIRLPEFRNQGNFADYGTGTTPLMIAAAEGNLELLERLLEAGADWSLSNAEGQTAVTIAASRGRISILKRLEREGAEVDYGSSKLHNQVLLEAVDKEDVEQVRWALQGSADPNVVDSVGELTALTSACLNGNQEIIRLLLDAGADPDHPSKEGDYPLCWAISRGHTAAVKLLLEAGASVNLEYPPGYTPAEQHNTVIPHRFCPLADAVAGGQEQIVEALLAAGADVNSVSLQGDSPLLAAVHSRNFEFARRLLERGAVPRESDADDLDILEWKARADSEEFRQSVQEVEQATGVKAEPVELLEGACAFRFSIPDETGNEAEKNTECGPSDAILAWSEKFNKDYASLSDRVNAAIDDLHEKIFARGFHLLDAGMPLGCGPMTRYLVLIPASNPYAIMASFGVRANDQEMNTREIIAWFRDFEQEHPFRLRGCKFDTIVIDLERPLDDPKTWARKLQEFDYDMWPDDDLTFFEKNLQTATRLNFWWD
jgi:ankyrin repeat protein